MAIYKGRTPVAGAGSTPSIDPTTKNWVIGGQQTDIRAQGDQITIDSEGYVNRNGSRTEHKLVQNFNDFTPDNNPYSENDFGTFDYKGEKILWKIDYYDLNNKYHSEDPSNPYITNRILTIMTVYEF